MFDSGLPLESSENDHPSKNAPKKELSKQSLMQSVEIRRRSNQVLPFRIESRASSESPKR
jgi:hypothetical protein